MKPRGFLVGGIVCLILLASGLRARQSAESLFQTAIYLEEVEGELEKAVELYERIVRDFAGDRVTAAKAVLRTGLCYEKLGSQEAGRWFQRVIDEYPDQMESVIKAREKLANFRKDGPPLTGGASPFKITKIFENTDKEFSYLSPDGEKVALVSGDGDLWIHDIESGRERRLTETANFEYLWSWSPDGATLAGLDTRNGLYAVSARGGEPITLVDSGSEFVRAGNSAWPTDWSPDGRSIICRVPARGLCAIPVAGGEWKDVFRVRDAAEDREMISLTSSPDGRFVAYESKRSGNSDIYVMPSGRGEAFRITDHPAEDRSPQWSYDGRWIAFITRRTGRDEIWVAGISREGRPEGGPFCVLRGFAPSNNYHWLLDGRIAVKGGSDAYNIFTADLEAGTETQLTNFLAVEREPRWSPDGRSIAFFSNRGGRMDLWLVPAEGGEPRNITPPLTPPDESRFLERPFWLPGGEAIVVRAFLKRSGNEEVLGLWKVSLGGAPLEKASFSAEAYAGRQVDLSPDGSYLAFASSGSRDPGALPGSRRFESDIWVVPCGGGTPKKISESDEPGLDFLAPRWSPDGSKIAFQSINWTELQAGKPCVQVWVREFPGGEGEALSVTAKTRMELDYLAWSPDGGVLYFSMRQKESYRISRVPADGGDIEIMGIEASSLDISPDGKKAAYCRRKKGKREYWIVENFLPESGKSK